MKGDPIRVLIAEDQSLVRRGLVMDAFVNDFGINGDTVRCSS